MLALGRLYIKQTRYKEAIIILSKSVKLDSKNTYAILELGKAYVKNEDIKDGERCFEEVIKIIHKIKW